MNRPKTILIADDHPLILSGLQQEINKRSDCRLIHMAKSGKEAWQALQANHPDIAILDIRMGKPNGLEIANRLSKANSPIDVILLTMYHDLAFIQEARNNGVKGYLLKDYILSELNVCLDAVIAGDNYLSSTLQILENQFDSQDNEFQTLTRMEKKVFRLIGEGKTNKEIGTLLFVSPKTVDNHRYNIIKKMNLQGSNALLIRAVKAIESKKQDSLF